MKTAKLASVLSIGCPLGGAKGVGKPAPSLAFLKSGTSGEDWWPSVFLKFFFTKTAQNFGQRWSFLKSKGLIFDAKLTGMGQIVSNQVSFVLSLDLGFVGMEEYFCSCCDLLELAPLDSFEVPHSRKNILKCSKLLCFSSLRRFHSHVLVYLLLLK